MSEHKGNNIFTIIVTLVFVITMSYSVMAGGVSQIQEVKKTPLADKNIKAQAQHAVPEHFREIPFSDKTLPPAFSSLESKYGYMLFKQPMVDPVYPHTVPSAGERLSELSGFGAQGEYTNLTFSVYPQRALKNFKVQVNDLKTVNGVIKAKNITVRLGTYWNIRYPLYTSASTYRRQPELLERVSAHSSPAKECQRWWLTIHIPLGTPPGLYQGQVIVCDDINAKALAIPLKFRVLGFKLLTDPAKHYSSYYRIDTPCVYKGKSKKATQKMLANEFKAMKTLGLNTLPVLYLGMRDNEDKITLWGAEQVNRMLQAGLKGPSPIMADDVIVALYKRNTPGGKIGRHWDISKMPPPKFYKAVEDAFRVFAQECKKNQWPEMYCGVMDEVTAKRSEFGAKVYAAVKKAGWKTLITKNPNNADAKVYADYVDVWCSQPFAISYKNIIGQNRYQYWCYPNHIAGEIKNCKIMGKGGRMTYGYGFWRSGYKTLMPWHWSWVAGKEPFNYLDSWASGCGQRFNRAGEVMPTFYWKCFQAGVDDARYIYTLQQAVWERANSTDPKCLELVRAAKEKLQALWNSIPSQQKYTNVNTWSSASFDTIRWELAILISKLLKYAPTNSSIAPPVIIDGNDIAREAHPKQSALTREIKRGNVEVKDLSKFFKKWWSHSPESKLSLTKDAGIDGKVGLRWNISVNYNIGDGWPNMMIDAAKYPFDFAKYDYLKFMIKIASNRNEMDDNITKLGFVFQSNKFFLTVKDLGGEQHVWVPVIFNIHDLINNTGNLKQWQQITMMQFFISESNYKDRTKLTFDIGSMEFLRFKSPVIVDVDLATTIMLPVDKLSINYKTLGNINDNYRIMAMVIDSSGNINRQTKPSNITGELVLNTKGLLPGSYNIQLELLNAGKICSKIDKHITLIKGYIHE